MRLQNKQLVTYCWTSFDVALCSSYTGCQPCL